MRENSSQNSDVCRVVNRVVTFARHVVNLSYRRRSVANFFDIVRLDDCLKRIHIQFIMTLKFIVNVINFVISFLVVVKIFGINQMFISDNVRRGLFLLDLVNVNRKNIMPDKILNHIRIESSIFL